MKIYHQSHIMTRKCVMCKETNYRNTYSFFSAPKDPELRKKWQNAIAIENYSVTDDTYVCSKHFHKDDIITHWVSGVPPHVITIKYKKCRLRPGAVPGRNYHLKENIQTKKHSDDSDVNIDCYSPFKSARTSVLNKKGTHFVIPRTEAKLQISCDKDHNISSLYQFPQRFMNYSYISKKQNDIQLLENGSNPNNYRKIKELPKQNLSQTKQDKIACLNEESFTDNTNEMENIKYEDIKQEQNQIYEDDKVPNRVLNSSFTVCNTSKKDEALILKQKSIRKGSVSEEKTTDNDFNDTKNIHIENQIVDHSNYSQLETVYTLYNDNDKNEMLFEDLLEVCTEVLLPRGWSCLVTSKGHTTTIVYLYMGMTKDGMPFTEKQVFIKSDMTLHCAAVNKDINPLIHNLIRKGKHLKVQNLVDIEELIDEFDQRVICQGIQDTDGFQTISYINYAYNDGIKWRHMLCPLLVNNDSSRCTRCISLSHTLQQNTENFFSFPYNRSILIKNYSNRHFFHQKCKRLKKQDHKYEFVNIFK